MNKEERKPLKVDKAVQVGDVKLVKIVKVAREDVEKVRTSGQRSGQRSGAGGHLDGGYAWVVLAATFVAAVICNGFLFNVGIFYVIFLEHFGQSRAVTSWLVAAQGIGICIAGPVSSVLLPRLGARKTLLLGALISSAAMASMFLADSIIYIIITFAIIGFGGGLLITSTLAGVALYFDQYLYMAAGFVNSGVGVGIMVLGVQIERTVETFGWRGSMLIQCGVALQMLVCGVLIFDIPKRLSKAPESPPATVPELVSSNSGGGGGGHSLRVIFKDLRFLMLLCGFFLYFAMLTILMGLMKDLAISKGLAGSYDVIIACFGVANTLGRALSGVFATYVHPPLLFFVASVLCALAVLGMALTNVRWLYLCCVVLFSFNTGQQAVLQSLTLSFIYSRQMMAILYGYGMFLGSVSIVAISPLVGYMIDSSGSFDSALYLASGGLLACGSLFLVSYWLHLRTLSRSKLEKSLHPQETERLKPAVAHQSR